MKRYKVKYLSNNINYHPRNKSENKPILYYTYISAKLEFDKWVKVKSKHDSVILYRYNFLRFRWDVLERK